ncbi:unnamed protein product [Parnassius apollo]|uniref:Protein MIS12 homolog n=1 Tax=Parnassius apollo TaxID=110799 RepID=A0A8S3VY08_PARAO|nr:unnamed protein product [Parnassius apollo]
MSTTESWSGGTDEEYETQHFGFGAQRFKIAVRQMVKDKIREGVKEMESFLQEELDLNDTDKAALTQSCDNLINLYYSRADPSFKIIDDEIERMLKIPDNVLLPEDEIQLQQVSKEEYNNLKEEVALLRKRVERAALMESLLNSELEELESVEKVCEAAKKDMQVLDLLVENFGTSDSVKAIADETESLCASVPFIKESENTTLDG